MNRLFLIGLSHKTAPVEWRERLAAPEEKLPALLKGWTAAGGLSEAVVLSTCNRVEVYGVAPEDSAAEAVRRDLTALHGDPALGASLYLRWDGEAVRHLMAVATGLDSLVVGESEILGQVKRAYELARSAGTTGKLTNVLFQRALYVGKLARARTGVAEGPSSVPALAVALAQRIFGSLSESAVLVVGAGEMAEQALHAFLSQKVPRLTVANRTLAKAQELAARFRGKAAALDRLAEELASADVVLCSTGSPEPVLRRETVAEGMSRRRGRPLFLIDIAVPRDVDPAAGALENVYLYDIDDLQSLVAESLTRRRGEIEKAERLADGLAEEFSAWYAAWQKGDAAALRHAPPDVVATPVKDRS